MGKNKAEIVDTYSGGNSSNGWLSNFLNQKKFMDSWSNLLTGLGMKNKDARNSSQVQWRRLTEIEIENLYAGDSQAASIVDLPIEEAMSKGYELKGITPEENKRLLARAKELNLDGKVEEAAKKARRTGGAAILRVYDNDDLRLDKEMPDVEKRTPLKNLLVLHRFELWADYADIEGSMLSQNFNEPRYYTFFGRSGAIPHAVNIKIHHTRLCRFDGAYLPENLRSANGYWHDSVLSKPYDAIRNYAFGHDGVNAALKDLSVAVFKVNGLADDISSNGGNKVLKRLEMVNLSKSIARAVILDAEGEDFEYKVRNLTGASDLLDRAESRLATEAKIPETVLFGKSPKGGLGSEGKHDSENWYNHLETIQDRQLKPSFESLYTELAYQEGINADNLEIEFKPLWSQSDEQKAKTHEAQSKADRFYIEDGVLTSDEVRNSRFKSGKFSLDTTIDDTIDAAKLSEADKEKTQKQLNQNNNNNNQL